MISISDNSKYAAYILGPDIELGKDQSLSLLESTKVSDIILHLKWGESDLTGLFALTIFYYNEAEENIFYSFAAPGHKGNTIDIINRDPVPDLLCTYIKFRYEGSILEPRGVPFLITASRFESDAEKAETIDFNFI